MIEGVPIVTEVLESVGPAAEIAVGDEILAVDGEVCADRIARVSRYISASTPQALRNLTFWWMVQQPDGSSQHLPLSWLVGGAEGSVAKLEIRDRAGGVKNIELVRSRVYTEQAIHQRSGDILRSLPENIGYADLDRLQPSMVDDMLERFRDAKAIVFDVRGYPQGTAWAIAPRLTEASAPVAALFRTPMLSSPDLAQASAREMAQRLPATDKRRYAGKTFLLVDERTRSQGEHTGLFLEAANGTPFVGGPTDGANGDVTDFVVPGGICISFTGREVRHADGRQLQRLGLVPQYEVEPTIAGIRAGRDEVLEKALELAR